MISNVSRHANWRRAGVVTLAIVLAAASSISLFAVPNAQAATPVLTVTPLTWNVIGLDSNTPATGPNRFPIGARVCNATGADAATDVSASFAWDSSNAYINLRPGSLSVINLGAIAAGSCADAYFEVEVDKAAAAFDTTRRYHITATDAASSATATTAQPRELYVEHLISQNRNGVTSIKLDGAAVPAGGSMTLMVGNTYGIELAGYTATQGYNQLEAFINFPNTIFQTLAVSTTYTADSSNYVASPNDKLYADGCLWDNDPNSPNYRSCIGDDGKAGGTVVTTYTVKILSGAGTTQSLNSLLYDFSGSSYHYNADFSLAARVLEIVAPASVTISKKFTPQAIAPGGTSAMTFTISNPTAEVISGVNFADTLLGGLQVAGTPAAAYSGCGAGAFVPAPVAADTSLSFSNGALAPNSVCTISVNVTAPAGTYPNTTGHLFINGTTDTGNQAEATLVAASAPSCVAGQTLASWTVPNGTTVNPPDTAGGLPTVKASNVATATASANVVASTVISTGGGQGDSTSWKTWGYKIDGQHIDFVVDTSQYSNVFMDFYVSNPGGANAPTSLVLSYSTGGGFTTLPTNFIPGAAFTLRTQDLSGLTNTTGNTTFRLTGSNAVNDQIGANLDYDNIRFYGCGTPAPAPTISKSFASDPIVKGATSTLTFTIDNTAAGSVGLSGVSFTDVLPVGLSIVDSSSAQCGGGTLTTTQASRTMALTAGSLAAASSCTFGVAVTGDREGQYENITGFVTSTESGPTTSYATDSLTVIAPPTLTKSFSPASILLNGTSTLAFAISNPNQLTALSGVGFTDVLPPGMTIATTGPSSMCGGTLTTAAPSSIELIGGALAANTDCTFTVQVTGTVSGTHLNATSAITSIGGGTGNIATATLIVNDPTAAIDLIKQVSTDSIDWLKFVSVPTGGDVFYRFAVYNGGDATITAISIVDPTLGTSSADPATCSWSTPLVSGATAYCVTGPISAVGGSQPNTATATGEHLAGTATSAPSTATYATPGLTLDKRALESQFTAAGDTLNYSYLVTNTGFTPLLGSVTVADDKSADESCPAVETVGDLDNYLDPGESVTCTATYVVQSADVTAGSVTNTATATIDGVSSPTDQVSVPLFIEVYELTLVKTAPPATYDSVGDVINYSYLVTNSGNMALSGPFTVSDDQATDETCPATASLAPGASITCTATDTVTQQDIDNGSLVNIASASNGTVTSATDTATVNAVQTPSIALVKMASPTTVTAAGQIVDYTFVVTNNGGVTLTGVAVTDPLPGLSAVSCLASTLAPTASTTCTATYTTTQADINAGTIANTATATGDLPQGGTVTDSDSVVVTATQAPQITAIKTTSETSYSTVGRVLSFTVTATNTGNVTLTNVVVTDTNATISSCSPSAPATLAPGAAMTCTATHATTQADLDSGSVQNVASTSGTTALSTTVSDDSNVATVPADRRPAITLAKSTTSTSFFTVGQQIAYTLTASNTGNVTVTGVAITDPNAVIGLCTPATPTALAPGQSVSCTAVHTVTQADVSAGAITNTAHAAGDMGIVALVSNSNTVIVSRGVTNQIPSAGINTLVQLLWTACLVAAGVLVLVIGKRRKPTRRTRALQS